MRALKKIICLQLVLALCVGLLPLPSYAQTGVFSGGSGTKDDPYLIATAAQLNEVRNYRDKYFKMTANIAFRASDFAEGGAFYNDGMGWKPIGDASKPFNGTFDGNGKTISGLRQTMTGTSSSTSYYGGLFGYMKYASVTNLKLSSATIQASGKGKFYVGGIAGYLLGMKPAVGYSIYQCSVSGTVTCESTGTSNSYVGGLIGAANTSNTSDTSESYNCYVGASTNTATIKTNMGYAGGITGQYARVFNCTNSGTITAEGKAVGAGGISGSGAIAFDSRNTGKISGPNAGGINGTYGIVVRCYNTGNVVGVDCAGGIVGHSSDLKVEDSFNTGSVSGAAESGGIAGSGAKIYQCYNIGTVQGTTAGSLWGMADHATGSKNNYYLDSGLPQAGAMTSTSSGDYGTKCTDAKMRQQATFVGFDFDTVWTMAGNANYPYPELKSVTMSVQNPSLTAVSISGDASCEIPKQGSAATVTLTATGTYQNSYVTTTKNVTNSATWSVVGAPAGVSVSKGVVTVEPTAAAGTVTVQTTLSGKKATHTITLIDPCEKGHAWGDWSTTVEPTYVCTGMQERVCNRCGENDEQAIAATGQSVVDAIQKEWNGTSVALEGVPADVVLIGGAYCEGKMVFAQILEPGAGTICVPDGIEWDRMKVFFVTEQMVPIAKEVEYTLPQNG